jgi:transcriptional regulator with XRE-family HTH domain
VGDDPGGARRGRHIGKNTVNRIKKDHTEPRPPTLRKLAQALAVDPAELVGRDARTSLYFQRWEEVGRPDPGTPRLRLDRK